MSFADLGKVLKIFGGNELSAAEKADLAKEAMLMVLARATAADTNIKQVEVDTVRKVLKTYTGEEFSSADIRVAAQTVLYEKAPLDRYVASASRKLDASARLSIANALKEVVKSDDRISDHEISFFNLIVNALDLTPAQLMGIE
ncbi:MAG: TerB family tellurite resistance protein [Pseudomonadales bacterium]